MDFKFLIRTLTVLFNYAYSLHRLTSLATSLNYMRIVLQSALLKSMLPDF